MLFLCSLCRSAGTSDSTSWEGCRTLLSESINSEASSTVHRYRSSVWILYMYFVSLRGSRDGRCHCETSFTGEPCWARLSTVRVKRVGCLYEYSMRALSRSDRILVILQVLLVGKGRTAIEGILLWSAGIVGHLDATTLVQRIVEEVQVRSPVEAVVDWS
jgi:hypothetical protein